MESTGRRDDRGPRVAEDSLEHFHGLLAPNSWHDVMVRPKGFDASPLVVERTVREWIRLWPSRHRPLLIAGPYGCGKKTVAYMACREAGWRSRLLNAGDLTPLDFGLIARDGSTTCLVMDLERVTIPKQHNDLMASAERSNPVIYLSSKHFSRKREAVFRRCARVDLVAPGEDNLQRVSVRAAYLLRDDNDPRFLAMCRLNCEGNLSKLVYDLSVYERRDQVSMVEERAGRRRGPSAVPAPGPRAEAEERATRGDAFAARRRAMARPGGVTSGACTEEDDSRDSEGAETGFNVKLYERQGIFWCTRALLTASTMLEAKKNGREPEWFLCRDGEDSRTQFDMLYEHYPTRCLDHADDGSRLDALSRAADLFSDVDQLYETEHQQRGINPNTFGATMLSRIAFCIEKPRGRIVRRVATSSSSPVAGTRLVFMDGDGRLPSAMSSIQRPSKPLIALDGSVRCSEIALRSCHENLVACDSMRPMGVTGFNLDLLPFLARLVRHHTRPGAAMGEGSATGPGDEGAIVPCIAPPPPPSGRAKRKAELVASVRKSCKKGKKGASLEANPFSLSRPFFGFVTSEPTRLVSKLWRCMPEHSSIGLMLGSPRCPPVVAKAISDAWAFNFSRDPLDLERARVGKATMSSLLRAAVDSGLPWGQEKPGVPRGRSSARRDDDSDSDDNEDGDVIVIIINDGNHRWGQPDGVVAVHKGGKGATRMVGEAIGRAKQPSSSTQSRIAFPAIKRDVDNNRRDAGPSPLQSNAIVSMPMKRVHLSI